MYYKATTKIPQQRLMAYKPTKKIKKNQKKCSVNPKITSKKKKRKRRRKYRWDKEKANSKTVALNPTLSLLIKCKWSNHSS